jgi:hypothetical protein
MSRAFRILLLGSALTAMVSLSTVPALAAGAGVSRAFAPASGYEVALAAASPATAAAGSAGQQSKGASPTAQAPKPQKRLVIPKAAQGAYDMSLTLPSYGLSGCMVCHSDPNLVRIKAGKLVSYYIDQKAVEHSAHARVACTGCHRDFSFTAPHTASADWRAAAKNSCQNCHKAEWDAYSKSVHGAGTLPGAKPSTLPKPLCGDCHGGHYIAKASTDPAAAAKLHASAQQICGDCHKDYWANYDDYYHGAAYRKGAPDAPACWDCHTAHSVLPSSDRSSATNVENLTSTCGKCHKNVSSTYTQYAQIIHKKDRVLAANPVYAVIRQTSETISGMLTGLVQALQSAFAPQAAKAATR